MINDVKSIMLTVGKFLKDKEFEIKIEDENSSQIITFEKNREYYIPEYQREIRWNDIFVCNLIDDLKTGAKYLGNIIINKKAQKEYGIIDGQQRITVVILLINYILKKTNDNSFSLCKLKNNSFSGFDKAMKLEFDIKKIEEDVDSKEILDSDVLEQIDSFNIIWNVIKREVDKLELINLTALLKNIKNSKINVILNDSLDDSDEEGLLVDYYLDINEKAYPLDNIDKLKGHLFRIKYSMMTRKWVENQKKIKELKAKGISITIEDFYYFYILSAVNESLNYKLKSLTKNYKLSKKLDKIKKGTHIVDAIVDLSFFDSMMDDIGNICDYFANIVGSQGINDEFKKKYACDNNNVSDISLKAYFTMQKSILLNSDSVPKILLIKYYIEELKKDTNNKESYDILCYIYVCSIMFSAAEKKKNIVKFRAIVFSENYKKELKKIAVDYLSNSIKDIDYKRKIKDFKGTITPRSGQYFPKDIFAIKKFFKPTGAGNIQVEKDKFNQFFSDIKYNIEHFFCPQSDKITIIYGNDKKVDIGIPSNVRKILSSPGNYLIMDKQLNKTIGNYWIIEKIQKIDDHVKDAFPDDYIKSYFEKIKKIFGSNKLAGELKEITEEDEAIERVEKFYAEEFDSCFDRYLEEIKNI